MSIDMSIPTSVDMAHYDIYVRAEQGWRRVTTVTSSTEAVKEATELQRDDRCYAIQIIAWIDTDGRPTPRLFYQFSRPDMDWIENSPAAAIIFQLPWDTVASPRASAIDKPPGFAKLWILLAGMILLAAAAINAVDLLD